MAKRRCLSLACSQELSFSNRWKGIPWSSRRNSSRRCGSSTLTTVYFDSAKHDALDANSRSSATRAFTCASVSLLAGEAVARFDFAFAVPVRGLRIRTQRPAHDDAFCGIVIEVLRRDDLLRRHALFHPLLQREQRVVTCVGGGTRAEIAEGIRSRAEAAVEHAGREEQTIKILCLGDAAGLPRDAVEVLRREARWDRAVEQAVILQQLAAATAEGAEIGLRCIHQRAELGARGRQILAEIERAVIPIRLLEHEAAEVAAREHDLQALSWCRAECVLAHAAAHRCSFVFAGRHVADGVQRSQRGDLCRGQALRLIATALARKHL